MELKKAHDILEQKAKETNDEELKKALTIGATSINYLLVGSYLKKEAESK
jgi:hypothetical protein